MDSVCVCVWIDKRGDKYNSNPSMCKVWIGMYNR